ncbi:sulfotransferase domain-containing protein [Leptolyngbya sp. FACHB-16]|uniref:sulfotransferase domain-containing protein n=1 Tax=unclassified Leptolyngbya TaxID=2650499 RepID=UPI0016875B9A|nr:sulfotransferase domain-containing protein [Leptolyngbya sp. FACHB-16]MBD2156188.1 sulfotransferase domain-containing protein [Leptolyngbya sp. FACHB-16]
MSPFANIGKPILIASHPRSGTHLTIDLLRKQFHECASWKYPGESLGHLYLPLEGLTVSTQKMERAMALGVLQRSQRPILKTHDHPTLTALSQQDPEWFDWIKTEATRLYIFRDGRDVLCSFHLYMQSFHAPSRCSLSEFLRQPDLKRTWIRRWVEHVERWLAEPDVTPLQFEKVLRQPFETLTLLGQVLDLTPKFHEPLLPRPYQNIWQSRWNRLTAQRPESTAILGFYKGQKKQRWQQHFTRADREFFHQEAGALLIRLGYESSDDWIDRESRPNLPRH